MRPCAICLLLFVLVGSVTACRSPYAADQGAAIGGVTGALAGAAIGKKHGNPVTGAVVGSAVGALTGAAIGSEIDRAREEIQARLGRPLQGAARVEDVIAMTQAGVSTEVMVTHVRAFGVERPVQARDIIALHEAGVPDAVINAMLEASRPQPPAAVHPTGAPVIIEEHYYTPFWSPPWHGHVRYRSVPPRGHARFRFSWHD